MLTTRSQRWRSRRASFVDNLSVIDPRRYAVDALETPTARAFIAAHHYLPSYPAARLAVGLFGPGPGGRSALAGVAVFGVPTTGAVITRHAGLGEHQGCTLARLILLDDVAGNGESFFIARALRLLRQEKPEIEAVVSYSDPMAGHIGQVYCASNAAYRGGTAPRTGYAIGGTPVSGRSLSKIRLRVAASQAIPGEVATPHGLVTVKRIPDGRYALRHEAAEPLEAHVRGVAGGVGQWQARYRNWLVGPEHIGDVVAALGGAAPIVVVGVPV